MPCKFLKRTADGPRCVLMPLEEWRSVGKKIMNSRCFKAWESCEILLRYKSMISRLPRLSYSEKHESLESGGENK